MREPLTAAASAGAVAVPGQRLQDLPAALPVPRGRPAAGAAERAGRAGHPGAQRAGADVRPARGRADTRADRRAIGPAWEQMAQEHPELLGLLPDRRTGRPGCRPRRTWSGRTSPWRIHAVSTRRPASSRSRSRWPTLFRCGVSSTGSTLRRPANCGSSTTRPAARPDPDFEARALYQLKFYALMIYRLRGVVPAQLKLIYLADGLSLQYAPTESELLSFENGRRRAVAGDHQRAGDRQLPAAAQRDVPVLRAPGAVPGVRRHPAAVPGARGPTAAIRAGGPALTTRRPRCRGRWTRPGHLAAASARRATAGRTGCPRPGSPWRRARPARPSPG